MDIANGASAARSVRKLAARRLSRDADRRQLGRRDESEGDDGCGAAGTEAGAALVTLVRWCAVVSETCRRAGHHVMTGVRAMRGAWRQRRRNGEHNAEPERPEGRDQSQEDGAAHKDRIHPVETERIPTALAGVTPLGRIQLGVIAFAESLSHYHNTLTVCWWCRHAVGTNMPT